MDALSEINDIGVGGIDIVSPRLVDEEMERMMPPRRLERAIGTAVNGESCGIAVDFRRDAKRARTDDRIGKFLIRRDFERHRLVRRHHDERNDFRLLDLPLMAGPPPVERLFRHTRELERDFQSIGFHGITRVIQRCRGNRINVQHEGFLAVFVCREIFALLSSIFRFFQRFSTRYRASA